MPWKKLPDATKAEMSVARRSRRVMLYADEDIEEEVVDAIRERGVNITSAREIDGHRGKQDEFHAAYSFREKRFLLTKNGRDFLSERALPTHRTYGVIVLDGAVTETIPYSRAIINMLEIVPYADSYVGSKIQVSDKRMTIRFPGQKEPSRFIFEDDGVYVWEDEP